MFLSNWLIILKNNNDQDSGFVTEFLDLGTDIFLPGNENICIV